MSRTLSISNRKGGTGKTTTTVNVSAALAYRGHRVLVIDADPQAHTTLSFGLSSNGRDLYSYLVDQKSPQEVITDTGINGLKVIPSTRKLTEYERLFSKNIDAKSHLKGRLEDFEQEFDYILFDTAPTLSLMTVSALIASDEVYIPMQTRYSFYWH